MSGSYLFIDNFIIKNIRNMPINKAIVSPYPRLNVIENISAPVSPNVVEAILIIQ